MSKKAAAKINTPPPQSAEQTMSQAWQAFGEGQPRQAEALCARLLKAEPAHAHAWFLRALCAAALGKNPLVLKYFDKVQGSPELLPGVAQGRGRALLALERVDEDLTSFQEALRYKPDDASTYYFIGLAQLRLGSVDEGRRFLRQCTLLEPKFGQAHYELGILAMHSAQVAQARASFRLAVEHLPKSPEAANNLGLAEQAAGDGTAAEAGFRLALTLDKNYAEAWYNLGKLLGHLHQDAQAREALQQAFRLNPALRKVAA